jgi:hypothetical protein
VKKAKSATPSPRLSDAAVEAKTGKTWQEWFSVFDAAGARQMHHQRIAAYLYKQLRRPRLVGSDGDRGLRAGSADLVIKVRGLLPGLNVNFY